MARYLNLFHRLFIFMIAMVGLLFSLVCCFINIGFINQSFDQSALLAVLKQFMKEEVVESEMNSSSPLTPSMSTIGAFVLLGFAGTSTSLTSASLFVGAFRKAPLLLLPWIIATTILLILLIITIFAVFFIGGHSYTAISAIAMAEAMFIICLGCLGVVFDFKTQLEKEHSQTKVLKA